MRAVAVAVVSQRIRVQLIEDGHTELAVESITRPIRDLEEDLGSLQMRVKALELEKVKWQTESGVFRIIEKKMGSATVSIAKRAVRLSAEPPLKPYVDIPRMANIALEMLRDALDCFLNGDTEKAFAICRRDAEVDQINKQLARELTSFMLEDPATITRALNLTIVARCLERVADHCKNIAEEVYYLYQARDIRHEINRG